MNRVIMHVTAALGGGVAHSLSQLAIAQANDGYTVFVAYSRRPETPNEEILKELFPDPIRRVVLPFATEVSPLADLKGIFFLVRLLRKLKPTVIHLHSSKAGVLGRLAARFLGRQAGSFYSPRGFSFLREDVGVITRKIYVVIERMAAKLGGTLVACSESEASLARSLVRPLRLAVVENSVQLDSIPMAKGSGDNRLRVVTSGRICFQKGPWHVRNIALALREQATFTWIGDGEHRRELEANGELPDNVSITGWMNRKGVIAELMASDVFLLPSLWEGMPLALIEAQAAGLPAIVFDVVGCRDVVINEVSGFICKDVQEMAARIQLLAANPGVRSIMGRNARAHAFRRFSVARMHKNMCMTYGLTA